MESSRTCPWPRGTSRTISIVLGLEGLGLVGYVLGLGLGLVDKVLEFTKDTYTSSADRARMSDRMLSDLVMLKCNKHI